MAGLDNRTSKMLLSSTLHIGPWLRKFLGSNYESIGKTFVETRFCMCIEVVQDIIPFNVGSVVYHVTDSELSIRAIFSPDVIRNANDSESTDSDHVSASTLPRRKIFIEKFRLFHLMVPGTMYGDFVLEVFEFVPGDSEPEQQENIPHFPSLHVWSCDDPNLQAVVKKVYDRRGGGALSAYAVTPYVGLALEEITLHSTVEGILPSPEIQEAYGLNTPGSYSSRNIKNGYCMKVEDWKAHAVADLKKRLNCNHIITFGELCNISDIVAADTHNRRNPDSLSADKKINFCGSPSKTETYIKNDHPESLTKCMPNLVSNIQGIMLTKDDSVNEPLLCTSFKEDSRKITSADAPVLTVSLKDTHCYNTLFQSMQPKIVLKRLHPSDMSPQLIPEKCPHTDNSPTKAKRTLPKWIPKTLKKLKLSPSMKSEKLHLNIPEKNMCSREVKTPPVYDDVLQCLLTDSQISEPLPDSLQVFPSLNLEPEILNVNLDPHVFLEDNGMSLNRTNGSLLASPGFKRTPSGEPGTFGDAFSIWLAESRNRNETKVRRPRKIIKYPVKPIERSLNSGSLHKISQSEKPDKFSSASERNKTALANKSSLLCNEQLVSNKTLPTQSEKEVPNILPTQSEKEVPTTQNEKEVPNTLPCKEMCGISKHKELALHKVEITEDMSPKVVLTRLSHNFLTNPITDKSLFTYRVGSDESAADITNSEIATRSCSTSVESSDDVEIVFESSGEPNNIRAKKNSDSKTLTIHKFLTTDKKREALKSSRSVPAGDVASLCGRKCSSTDGQQQPSTISASPTPVALYQVQESSSTPSELYLLGCSHDREQSDVLVLDCTKDSVQTSECSNVSSNTSVTKIQDVETVTLPENSIANIREKPLTPKSSEKTVEKLNDNLKLPDVKIHGISQPKDNPRLKNRHGASGQKTVQSKHIKPPKLCVCPCSAVGPSFPQALNNLCWEIVRRS